MPVDFQKIVFFGDSLTDSGNLPEPARPDAPYVGGRFTNGPVYAEVLAGELGVRSENRALGGAEASTEGDDGPLSLINLDAQVDGYLAAQGFGSGSFLGAGAFFGLASFFGLNTRVEPGTAASIFIGSNDLLNERPSTPAQGANLVGRIVSNIGEAVADLAGAGASRVFLYTLPNVSDAPASQSLSATQRASADQVIAATNQGIKGLAAQASAQIPVTVVDVNRLQAEIRSDRETFGLKVLETPVYTRVGDNLVATGVTKQASINEVAFFDPLHPTAASHGIIAAFSEATIRSDSVQLRIGGTDNFSGGSGADFVFTGAGADRVSGRAGDDVLFGGRGDDIISGGLGNDLVVGGGGNDRMVGVSGEDLLAGGAGDDRMRAGAGNDVLVDGSGGDALFGDSGNDMFVFRNNGLGNGFDQFDGGSGRDTLRLKLGGASYANAAVKAELQEFAALLKTSPGSAFTFDTLDLSVTSIERLEVQVGSKTVFSAGAAAVAPSVVMASLMRDADLWGIL
ncbi:MAG TPA: SGNH/GDSL hydrolase family protein [Microvirga sp.]|jgi:phospholipase/lecithinase/hemolysin